MRFKFGAAVVASEPEAGQGEGREAGGGQGVDGRGDQRFTLIDVAFTLAIGGRILRLLWTELELSPSLAKNESRRQSQSVTTSQIVS